MAGGLRVVFYDRQLELAEQGVTNAQRELTKALHDVKSAAFQIERRAEVRSVWSTDQIEYLTKSTAQVVAWNAVLTERRNHLRAVQSWGERS